MSIHFWTHIVLINTIPYPIQVPLQGRMPPYRVDPVDPGDDLPQERSGRRGEAVFVRAFARLG